SFGQILTDDLGDVRRRKAEILREMEAFRVEKGLKASYMIVTDALTYESEVWAVGAADFEIAEGLTRLKNSPQAKTALQQFSALPANAGRQAEIGNVEGPRRRGAFYVASVALPGYVSRKSMWKDVVEQAVGDQYSKSARIHWNMAGIAVWERTGHQ